MKWKVPRMSNLVSSFYMLGVAEAEMLLQFPFLVREKGALIDRQSLSCISLPQVATGLRFACRARSVGGALREQRAKLTCLHVNLATAATTGKHVCRCSLTKLCTWMTATCVVASHSSQRAVLQTAMHRIRRYEKNKYVYEIFQYQTGRWYDGDFSSFH